MNLLLVKITILVITTEFLQGEPSIEISSDSTVLVGSNVTLVCTVPDLDPDTSTINVFVKWSGPYPANTTEANCTNTVTPGDTVLCNLTLKSVEESSGGKYTCDGTVGGYASTSSTELHVVPYPTIELRHRYTGHHFCNLETGPICVPTTESHFFFFNCTVHNITDDASNITWTINGDAVNGEEVGVTSTGMTVRNSSEAGLGDMRSSLDVARWADEYQDQVINVACHFSGYKNIDPLEVTAQIKFYYDVSKSLLIGFVSCQLTFAMLAFIVVIVIVRSDDHNIIPKSRQ